VLGSQDKALIEIHSLSYGLIKCCNIEDQ